MIDAFALGQAKSPSSEASFAVSIGCETRTADDTPLKVFLETRATRPDVASIAQHGPDTQDFPALKTLILLLFTQKPESAMMNAIQSVLWDTASLHDPGSTSFRCTLTGCPSSSDSTEGGTFQFSGTGEELCVMFMALASLECHEDGGPKHKKGQWVPCDGRIRLAQVDGAASGQYQLRVLEGDLDGAQDKIIRLGPTHIRALLDCFDAFVESNPRFGLPGPRLQTPPVARLRVLGGW